jgi:hypothetical protein
MRKAIFELIAVIVLVCLFAYYMWHTDKASSIVNSAGATVHGLFPGMKGDEVQRRLGTPSRIGSNPDGTRWEEYGVEGSNETGAPSELGANGFIGPGRPTVWYSTDDTVRTVTDIQCETSLGVQVKQGATVKDIMQSLGRPSFVGGVPAPLGHQGSGGNMLFYLLDDKRFVRGGRGMTLCLWVSKNGTMRKVEFSLQRR